MSDHYYTRTPQVKSDPQEWEVILRGKRLRLKTDAGVFSKKEVDFGSKLLLESFVVPDVEGLVLDVGCGYGPIGLSVATTHPERLVHLIDINERAVALATHNAKVNGISNVEVYASDLFSKVKDEQVFAAVLSNPPIRTGKQTVFRIYEEAFKRLVVGGELWIVIQKKQGAPSTMKRLEELFGNVQVIQRDKGYFVLKSTKV